MAVSDKRDAVSRGLQECSWEALIYSLSYNEAMKPDFCELSDNGYKSRFM